MNISRVSIASIFLKIATAVASIAQVLILVDLVSKEDFGRFSSILAQVTIFTVICLQGSRQLLVRERPNDVQIDTFFAIVINAVFFVVAVFYNSDNNYEIYFLVLLFLNINIVFLSVILKSEFQILKSQLYLLLKPILLVILVYLVSLKHEVSLEFVLISTICALILVLFYYLYSAKDIINLKCRLIVKVMNFSYLVEKYRKIPIFLVNGASQITYTMMPILVLTYNGSFAEIAEYRVAERFSEVISYGLVAISSIISPLSAKHFSRNDTSQLKKDIIRINRVNFAYQIIALATVFFFGQFLIVSVLGSEYQISSDLLLILAIGQLFSCTIGPVSILLTMSNNEFILMRVTLFFLVVSYVGGYFIVDYGIYYLAIFCSVSYSLLNVFLAFFLYRKTKILSFSL